MTGNETAINSLRHSLFIYVYVCLVFRSIIFENDLVILFVCRAPVLVALALIELGMKYEDAVELIRE